MDGQVEPEDGGRYDPGIEPRLSRVEHDVQDVKETLSDLKALVLRMDARFEAILPHLATKQDIASIASQLVATEARIDAKMDARFKESDARIDARLTATETRVDDRLRATEQHVDARLRATEQLVDARLHATEQHVDDRLRATEQLVDARLHATEQGVADRGRAAEQLVEARLSLTDARMAGIEARLDATLPHLATKADVAHMPTKTYMWGIMAALLTAYACGLAALAVLR
jgi:hypothetical protein